MVARWFAASTRGLTGIWMEESGLEDDDKYDKYAYKIEFQKFETVSWGYPEDR